MTEGGGGFGPAEMRAALEEIFAPWVRALGLEPVAVEADGAVFRLPCGPDVARRMAGGDAVLCGQAMAAAADSASGLALAGVNGRWRDCTTVDLTIHFMRPVATEAAEIRAAVLSNGRRLATTRVELRPLDAEGRPGRLAASATCTFAYLED